MAALIRHLDLHVKRVPYAERKPSLTGDLKPLFLRFDDWFLVANFKLDPNVSFADCNIR